MTTGASVKQQTIAWVALAALAVPALIFTVFLAWAVLSTMNWDLLFGNDAWSPAGQLTAPPTPTLVEQAPPQPQPAPAPAPPPR